MVLDNSTITSNRTVEAEKHQEQRCAHNGSRSVAAILLAYISRLLLFDPVYDGASREQSSPHLSRWSVCRLCAGGRSHFVQDISLNRDA